jgi:hypothetical protein
MRPPAWGERRLFRLFAPLIARSGKRLEDNNWQNMKRYLEATRSSGGSPG